MVVCDKFFFWSGIAQWVKRRADRYWGLGDSRDVSEQMSQTKVFRKLRFFWKGA